MRASYFDQRQEKSVKKLKVFLCQGLTGLKEPLVFPLGLAYIASALGKHDLMCYDPNISPQNYLDKFAKRIEHFAPDVVGLSLRNIDNPMEANGSYYAYFVAMIRKLKEIHPTCKLVVGGAGFSIFIEEIMRLNPEIDFGVFSEGEQTFPDLLENLDHPHRVKGLFVRKDDDVIFSGRRGYLDFASLPPPSREAFDVQKYAGGASMGIQTKRGCRFKCIYCLHNYYMGSHYRIRKPKHVVDEIETIVNQYNIRNFYFADPVFNFPSEHGLEICRDISRRKLDIKWEGCFRPDYLSKNYMQEALNAGCRLFDFSPDGASDKALQVLGKEHDAESIKRSIKWTSEIEGAKVAYEFMTAIPRYNSEHVRGLMYFVPKIISQCREKLSYLNLSKMRIYPNTQLYDIALEEGQINPKASLLKPAHYENKSFHKIENMVTTMLRASCIPNYTFTALHRYLTTNEPLKEDSQIEPKEMVMQ